MEEYLDQRRVKPILIGPQLQPPVSLQEVVPQKDPHGFLAPVSPDELLDGHFPNYLKATSQAIHWKRAKLYPGVNANPAQTTCE